MDYHGHALEYLLCALQAGQTATFQPDSVLYEVKEQLKVVYTVWKPLMQPEHATALLLAIICGHKLLINSTIPGKNLTVDEMLQFGWLK